MDSHTLQLLAVSIGCALGLSALVGAFVLLAAVARGRRAANQCRAELFGLMDVVLAVLMPREIAERVGRAESASQHRRAVAKAQSDGGGDKADWHKAEADKSGDKAVASDGDRPADNA